MITGVGRTVGIGAGIARRLAASGWNIAFTYWPPYDERMSWGREPGASAGRIISLTSDHTVGNLPYGASKGALDRITLAAAHELAHLGVTANAINPGPVDTGWMREEVREHCIRSSPLGRLGTPRDTAHLVDSLCSREGEWINGQLLMSNGGLA
nr:SDR family oxidoreductase [Streptomyces rimosus]